jgi:hypothetical protein
MLFSRLASLLLISQTTQLIKILGRDKSQAMMYLPGPGYFGYYKTIFGGIHSRASMLPSRQQWSIDGYCIYSTVKNPVF